MKEKIIVAGFSLVGFAAGLVVTDQVKEYYESQDVIDKLRSSPDIVEIEPLVFCVKPWLNEYPNDYLYYGSTCNTWHRDYGSNLFR